MITKQDFIDWKSNPVTKAYFQEVDKLIENMKEELTFTDVDMLRYKQGYIQSLKDILNVELQEGSE